MSLSEVSALPAAESVKRIAFERAEVVPGFVNDTYFLVVHGQAPCVNMKVMLSPLVYFMCPEYWGIEVIGYLRGGICLTAIKPYALTIPLAGITGVKGIEVLGGNRSERFEVPGGCGEGVSFA